MSRQQKMKQYQDDYYDSLLTEIKTALQEQALTQSQVGSCLGLKQSAVSSLLSGRSRMSLDQFFALSDLMGLLPQNLLQRASSKVQQVETMTQEMEETLYRSAVHVLCYCAAIKPLKPETLRINNVDAKTVREAFEELTKSGFLVEKTPGVFVQKNPRLTYLASTRLKGSESHQKICELSWRYFDLKYEDKVFLSNKFNLWDVDLFTPSQIKELDAALLKVAERIEAIKQSNLASGYSSSEPMSLWNLHLMMMTPVEVKYY
jgi:predicted transcriptional regulator